MKSDSYNGICITLIGSDGGGKNIPIAVGFVLSETVDNFDWFIANCIVGGVRFFDRALFVDRGKQRGAQQRLPSLGYVVNLKFCTFHIVLNVQDRFRSVDQTIDRVRPFVMDLQKATTITEYESILDGIDVEFPITRSVRGDDGKLTQQSVSQYLRAIHPVSWTRLGNFTSTCTELSYFREHLKESKAYGAPMPLFGIRTTGSNEGENNAMLFNGARDQEVFLSTLAFLERASQVFPQKQSTSRGWIRSKFNVTSKVSAEFEAELLKASSCTVNAVAGSTSVFEVVELKTASQSSKIQRIYRVDTDSTLCTRYTREQRRIPCRYLLAALANAGDSFRTMEYLFHAAYTTNGYEAFANSVVVGMPIQSDLVKETSITAPPVYRQSGSGRPLRNARDRAKRQHRIPNRGEVQGATVANSSKTSGKSLTATSLDGVLEQFAGQVRGAKKQHRKPYKCSLCGNADGHNAAKCPNHVPVDAPTGSDIIGGEYVVGSCLIALLQTSWPGVDAVAVPQAAGPSIV